MRLVPLRCFSSRLAGEREGATLVEMAFLLPVLLVLSFGLVDMALLLFSYHRAGEAVRDGTRTAGMVAPVADLAGLVVGDRVTCTSASGAISCGVQPVADAASFTAVVTRIQNLLPDVTADNVSIEYEISNVGDVTLPGGALPHVTVSLVNVPHNFTMLSALPGLPAGITFPAFSSSYLANGNSVAPPST